MRVFLGGLYSVPLIYMLVFVPIPWYKITVADKRIFDLSKKKKDLYMTIN